MTKFAKRHYEVVADTINLQVTLSKQESGETGWPKYDVLFSLAKDLCNTFRQDNPAFDQSRFLKSCGFGDW